jgi:hypothetical protein
MKKVGNKRAKISCIYFAYRLYWKSLYKAKMREVAELSGNFRGELSLPDRGEGARRLFFCAFFHGNAHERVQGMQA